MFTLIKDDIEVIQHHRLRLYRVGDEERSFSPSGTAFIAASDASLVTDGMTASGTFGASVTGSFEIKGPSLVIQSDGLCAPECITKVSSREPGSLSYIDGCSNTNLVSPPRNGDPCLNYLYFPPGTVQTEHVHPSVRIGVVLYGEGVAIWYDSGKRKETPLLPGSMFLLDRHTRHAFNTADKPMSLIAFHPDSDAGPTDEGNPMKMRTYIR